MEANNAAFQATPRKCDAPVLGKYYSCDSAGCAQNAHGSPKAFGPGPDFTINTVHPFEVRTEFPAKDGVLQGMRTHLRQGDRQIVLDHSACGDYLAHLSDAMAAGMSLRISYWGDQAKTMAWLDAPQCSWQVCSESSAEAAHISNISVEDVLQVGSGPLAEGTSMDSASTVWVISDPKDVYDGLQVPKHVVEDSSRFTEIEGHALVYWKDSLHRVARQKINTAGGLASAAAIVEEAPQTVWVVSDPEDSLFEQVIPEDFASDSERMFRLQGHHLVRWKGAMHLVKQVGRPADLANCGGDSGVPCKVRMNEASSWSSMILARYDSRPFSSTASRLPSRAALTLLSCTLALLAISAVVLRRRRMRPAERPQEFTRATLVGSPMKYSRLEAGSASPLPRSHLQQVEEEPTSLTGLMEDTIETSPARLRLPRERLDDGDQFL